MVATVRSDEACEDALVSLWKDLGAPRVQPNYLDEGDARLLSSALPASSSELLRHDADQHRREIEK